MEQIINTECVSVNHAQSLLLNTKCQQAQVSLLKNEFKAQLTVQRSSLESCVQQAKKQQHAWEAASRREDSAMKDLGDVRNWKSLLEHDLIILERALSLAALAQNRN